LVATGRTIPWANPWPNPGPLGQERIGSSLSIAVDPNDSKTLYIAWADRSGSDIYTLHLRRSVDRGQTWSGDLRTLSNATNPALAIAENGTAGFLYQQVTGSGGTARWATHLEQTRDAFAHIKDTVLANTPANCPILGIIITCLPRKASSVAFSQRTTSPTRQISRAGCPSTNVTWI